MNEKCFKFHIAKIESKGIDIEYGKTEFAIETDNKTIQVMDALLCAWDTTADEFINDMNITCNQYRIWPWAIALYEKEFNLAGHVVSIRQNREDFSFGSYSSGKGPLKPSDGVPLFSVLVIYKKSALEYAANHSLLFQESWKLLEDKEETLNWICFPSSPPEEWIKEKTIDNDSLFITTMKNGPHIFPVKTLKPPRKIIAEHFESLGGELPIRGGWGYTKEDACIIDKNDPIVDPSVPFPGISIEYIFVEKRIYEEMIILRPKGDKFSSIKWKLIKQMLIEESDRAFDKLIFDLRLFVTYNCIELERI